jgi:triosephosphate isomerase
VGEDWAKRQKKQSAVFVAGQLRRALAGVETKRLIIAYEPIWAIGSGRALATSDAVMMHGFIRQTAGRILGQEAKISVLYGGSVDAKNALGFLKEEEIDGLLIGGASLKPLEFKKIANIK